MRGWVTINTDAGFYRIEKVGSYAYWIKGDGLFLKGSGLFKDSCASPLEAEKKAIINALHVLEGSGACVEKIIVNRDNIYAVAGKKGSRLQKMMSAIIKRIKVKSIPPSHPNYARRDYCEFRHVKAHQKVISDARSYVNEWCDQQCKNELRKFKQQTTNERTDTTRNS